MIKLTCLSNELTHSKLVTLGVTGNIRESAKMAYDFLKANAKKREIDRELSSYDVIIQSISLIQGKYAHDLGMAI